MDIGDGSGTFAARMLAGARRDGGDDVDELRRAVLQLHRVAGAGGDADAPERGCVAARLPFPDGTMDLMHSMHVLCSWIPDAVLELALFDVLRVFWLDHFFCLGTQLDTTYVPCLSGSGPKSSGGTPAGSSARPGR